MYDYESEDLISNEYIIMIKNGGFNNEVHI